MDKNWYSVFVKYSLTGHIKEHFFVSAYDISDVPARILMNPSLKKAYDRALIKYGNHTAIEIICKSDGKTYEIDNWTFDHLAMVHYERAKDSDKSYAKVEGDIERKILYGEPLFYDRRKLLL